MGWFWQLPSLARRTQSNQARKLCRLKVRWLAAPNLAEIAFNRSVRSSIGINDFGSFVCSAYSVQCSTIDIVRCPVMAAISLLAALASASPLAVVLRSL
jgi:hypothetical protein